MPAHAIITGREAPLAIVWGILVPPMAVRQTALSAAIMIVGEHAVGAVAVGSPVATRARLARDTDCAGIVNALTVTTFALA
jgi:hypothetical protein